MQLTFMVSPFIMQSNKRCEIGKTFILLLYMLNE